MEVLTRQMEKVTIEREPKREAQSLHGKGSVEEEKQIQAIPHLVLTCRVVRVGR